MVIRPITTLHFASAKNEDCDDADADNNEDDDDNNDHNNDEM